MTFGTSVAGFASLVAEMVADGNVEESDCSIVVGRRSTSRFAKTGVMIRRHNLANALLRALKRESPPNVFLPTDPSP